MVSLAAESGDSAAIVLIYPLSESFFRIIDSKTEATYRYQILMAGIDFGYAVAKSAD